MASAKARTKGSSKRKIALEGLDEELLSLKAVNAMVQEETKERKRHFWDFVRDEDTGERIHLLRSDPKKLESSSADSAPKGTASAGGSSNSRRVDIDLFTMGDDASLAQYEYGDGGGGGYDSPPRSPRPNRRTAFVEDVRSRLPAEVAERLATLGGLEATCATCTRRSEVVCAACSPVLGWCAACDRRRQRHDSTSLLHRRLWLADGTQVPLPPVRMRLAGTAR